MLYLQAHNVLTYFIDDTLYIIPEIQELP